MSVQGFAGVFAAAAALALAACAAGPLASPLFAAAPSPLVTPAIEAGTEAKDSYDRRELRRKAAAGDAVAQYKLGNAYCCQVGGPLDRVSVYDNVEATRWYCQAARQNYLPAQLRLAQIYSGHPISGIRLMARASALVGDTRKDPAVALVYARWAADNGSAEAARLRDDLVKSLTPAQLARADALQANRQSAPCLWSDVFVGRTGSRGDSGAA